MLNLGIVLTRRATAGAKRLHEESPAIRRAIGDVGSGGRADQSRGRLVQSGRPVRAAVAADESLSPR